KSRDARAASRPWDIFACVPKSARHPDKLIQNFFHATGVSWIRSLAGRRVEKLSCGAEIDIPENRDEAELAQHRKQTLDHPRTAEWTSGHATDANRFMNVFREICIQHMLQQSWETV